MAPQVLPPGIRRSLAIALLVSACAAAPTAGVAAAQSVSPAPNVAKPAAAITIKERLSDKASDEQRVNDCKVPPEKRGERARPTDCPGVAGN